RTLAVIMGRDRTRAYYVTLLVLAFVTLGLGIILGPLPEWASLGFVTVPLALPPARSIMTRVDGPGLIAALGGTARLQLAVALAISVGLFVA
ncbi:MAG: 1,4-dihydroxy-2-naphthoate polyprenyltransferase, partial [Acidimicrobiia bacterium]|nr:1,4-dihydroxy-2-naphthoate polyprenyltransferase [Acidimicrobiia bacterium]